MIGFKVLVVFFCGFVLFSCGENDTSQEIYENYLYRLSNSLEVAQVRSLKARDYTAALKRYPSNRDLAHSIPSIKINLIEFLRLSRCDLQRLLGERNSSLGKLQKPSQKLSYDYQFIALTRTCLSQLDQESVLYKTLQHTLESKLDSLPLVKWNAVFSSEEFRHLFSLGSKPLSYSDLSLGMDSLLSALDSIDSFVTNRLIESSDIENSYGVINSSKRMGEIRLSIAESVAYLHAADQLLQQRIDGKPLCYQKLRNTQFDIVDTVFRKFYLGEVQPYIALLHQQASFMFEKINALTQEKNESVLFTEYWDSIYRGSSSEWKRFDEAVKNHTKNWQALLSQCGSLPS